MFGDVVGILRRIKKRGATVKDWWKFRCSIESFLASQYATRRAVLCSRFIVEYLTRLCVVRDQIETHRTSSDLSLSLFQRISREHDIRHVSNLLGNVIDFDESLQEESVVIRSGVSEVLDYARSRYEDLDNVGHMFSFCVSSATAYSATELTTTLLLLQVLTEVAFQIQESNPTLSSITVQYIPQVGYVVCCESPTTLPEFVFQFQEDDMTFYYKVSKDLSYCPARQEVA